MKQSRTVILFLLTILVFLFLANVVVYEAALLALGISRFSFSIMAILGIFGVSFILSSILGMFFCDIFTRTYYLLSMIWVGLFGYLFFASGLYVLLFPYLGNSAKFFALILFILTIATSAYGVLHARKLFIKNITVKLPGLPEIWQKRKVVWISDLHVGQINGEKYIGRVIKELKIISPDILFIGGDLFDGPTAPKILDYISQFLEFLVPLGMYFITGNHEGYRNSELFLQKIKETGIRVLNDEKIVLDNLQIIGVDFKTTAKNDDFKKVLTNLAINKDMPSILLKHEPRYIETAREAGVFFQISGHVHRAQQWPLEYFARLVYGRFASGLKWAGKMQVYTSSGTGTWGPPLRVLTNSEIVVFKFT